MAEIHKLPVRQQQHVRRQLAEVIESRLQPAIELALDGLEDALKQSPHSLTLRNEVRLWVESLKRLKATGRPEPGRYDY